MKKRELFKKIQHEKEFFDNEAMNESEYWGWRTKTGNWRHFLRGEKVKDYLGLNRRMRVLEIGCGIRSLTSHLVETGALIYVTDVSSRSVDVARRHLESSVKKNKLQRVSFKVEDAHRLSFTDNNFDAVFGNAILHHLDHKLALAEIHRVLVPGARFCFFEPNLVNPEIFIERKIPYFRKLSRSSPDETAFIRWRLRRDLQDAGFVNVSVLPFDFLYPAMPIFLAKRLKWFSDALEKIPVIREIAGSLIVRGEKPI